MYAVDSARLNLIFPQAPLPYPLRTLVTKGIASSINPFLIHNETNDYSVFSSYIIPIMASVIAPKVDRPPPPEFRESQFKEVLVSCPPLQMIGAPFSGIIWEHLWNTFQNCPPGLQRTGASIHRILSFCSWMTLQALTQLHSLLYINECKQMFSSLISKDLQGRKQGTVWHGCKARPSVCSSMKPAKIYLDLVTMAVPGVSNGFEDATCRITAAIMDNLPNSSPASCIFHKNSSDVAHDRKYYNLKEVNTHI